MSKLTPAAEYCKSLLEKFPKTPILTLAKKAVKDQKKLFLIIVYI